MRPFTIFMKYCVALSVIILLACGGGEGGSSAPPAPSTPNISSQTAIDFAGIVLDSSAERTIEITNTGTKNLIIGQVSQLNDPFEIDTDNCSNRTLSPSVKCSLTTRFFPTNQGPFTATLSIPSNDPDTSIKNINLSGVGYGLDVSISKVDITSCPSNIISIDVSVTNPRSTSPLTLTENSFTLYQNSQLQSITEADQYPAQASLVLALDLSGSMYDYVPQIKSAAIDFINQKLTNGDFAAVCRFADVVEFNPDGLIETIPAGKTKLIDFINSGFTSLDTSGMYDALLLSIDKAAQGTQEMKAVIVLSDGVDNNSVSTLDQVIAYANRNAVKVFSIFFIDPDLVQWKRPEVMQRLAGETGGQYYDATTVDPPDFASVYQKFSNVIENKYTLTYTSSTCAGTISVRADSGVLYGEDSATFP